MPSYYINAQICAFNSRSDTVKAIACLCNNVMNHNTQHALTIATVTKHREETVDSNGSVTMQLCAVKST